MIRTTRNSLLLCAVMGLAAIAGCSSFLPNHQASAHPLDRLRQHLLIQLEPGLATFTLAVGGGVLATDLVAGDLDLNHDSVVSLHESSLWSARVLESLHVQAGEEVLRVEPASVSVNVPDLELFRAGLEPLMLTFSADLPFSVDQAAVHLVVRNGYRVDRTDFLFDAQTLLGIRVVDAGWPSSTIRLQYARDPAAFGSAASPAATASAWGASSVAAKAQSLMERERSPRVLMIMVAVFVVMGALHAIQPGHGKALAATYLVATGGAPRDAFALAGIVTLTHTSSVFLLGGATIVASHLFMPSTVIPAIEVVSGLIVAVLGLTMLRRAVRGRWNAGPARDVMDNHPDHHHHGDLSDEEHARLHAHDVIEAKTAFSRKSLAALGVSGGMVPCPEALAILLVAIGINQSALGMMAIVAFSVGLAVTLVGFGLAIVMAGPLWSRLRATGSGSGASGSKRSEAISRLVAVAPVVSAVIVLLLGSAMLVRAGQSL